MSEALEAWELWWQGRPLVGAFRVGGFSGAWFDWLRRRRIKHLARHPEILTDALERIPPELLRAIGESWADFAQALGDRCESFARQLGPNTASFSRALGARAPALARGLGGRAPDFARGLGDQAGAFLEALEAGDGFDFLLALGGSLGSFLEALEDPEPAFAMLAANPSMLAQVLGPDITDLVAALGNQQEAWFERLGEAGMVELMVGLGLDAAALIRSIDDPARLLAALRPRAAELSEKLGEQTDQFLLELGEERRESLVLGLEGEVRHFIATAQQPALIYRVIAKHPEDFGRGLGEQAGSFALTIDKAPGFFEALDEPGRLAFLQALRANAGLLVQWLSDPAPVIQTLAAHPEELLAPLGPTELEELSRRLRGHALELGLAVAPQARSFAIGLAPQIDGFARGLGDRCPEFVRGLGGTELEPSPPPAWFGWLRNLSNWLNGNEYARQFLPALDECRGRARWLHAAAESRTLGARAQTNLRCSLCHIGYQPEETPKRCPTCRTVVHEDCLIEISGNRCHNDGTSGREFESLSLVPERATVVPEEALRAEPPSAIIDQTSDLAEPAEVSLESGSSFGEVEATPLPAIVIPALRREPEISEAAELQGPPSEPRAATEAHPANPPAPREALEGIPEPARRPSIDALLRHAVERDDEPRPPLIIEA